MFLIMIFVFILIRSQSIGRVVTKKYQDIHFGRCGYESTEFKRKYFNLGRGDVYVFFHPSRNFVRHVTSMKRFHDYGRTPELPKAAESVNFLQTAQKQDKCSKTQDQIRSSGKMKSCKPSAKSTRQLRRNERERCRKARLNAAFQVLRSVVPNNVSTGTSERKMTQVEILRLAKNYISNLTELLQDNNDYRYRTFCSD